MRGFTLLKERHVLGQNMADHEGTLNKGDLGPKYCKGDTFLTTDMMCMRSLCRKVKPS